MKEATCCLNCPKYKQEKERLLEQSDCIFDSVYEMIDFYKECLEKCSARDQTK